MAEEEEETEEEEEEEEGAAPAQCLCAEDTEEDAPSRFRLSGWAQNHDSTAPEYRFRSTRKDEMQWPPPGRR